MSKGYITRKHKFDAGHRVMHERMKCWSPHGHEYHVEITMEFDEMHSIGYAVDFKEIKRVACNYIDIRFDHGMILNPHDTILIEACRSIRNEGTGKHSKIHLMNLMGEGEFCNPSAENISKELFFACSKLLNEPNNCNLKVYEIKLWETENCFVTCREEFMSETDIQNLENSEFARSLEQFRKEMGTLEYDVRKASAKDLEITDVEN